MDARELELAERFVRAIERLAEQFAPEESKREKRPAILTTAKYDRDERERAVLRERLQGQKQKPETGATPSSGSR